MSLTSYRAAPPRVNLAADRQRGRRREAFPTSCPSVIGRPGSDLLSHISGCSTIGAGAFNGRVRNGIGFGHSAITTEPAKDGWMKRNARRMNGGREAKKRSRPDGHRLMRAIKSIELLVPVSFTCCHASTPGLSTWWSSTALKGELVSRGASRLDAFSGYPFRT
jgi:hypothetical protein